MALSVVKQYSVFLVNQPGALRNFTQLFAGQNVNLLALSQDLRFDAAIVRVTVPSDTDISHMLTKAGMTSIKTDALCLEAKDRPGLLHDVCAVLAEKNIQITSLYGSGTRDENGHALFILVVNELTQALSALESSGLF